MVVALITGVTGQDGSYLSEYLLSKDYQVHGIVKRCSTNNLTNIQHLLTSQYENRYFLHHGDLNDLSSIISVIKKYKPNEIYNLACHSHVKVSFQIPSYTIDSVIHGFLNICEAVRACNLEDHTKIYQASSSDMYGANKDPILNEDSRFLPASPYASAKLCSHNLADIYRYGYKMFICCGILFNHESPRRNANFVIRKITKSIAKIKLGQIDHFFLGNTDAVRDWGHARDYVQAMWLMLQQDQPDDFVIATGESHSVKELTNICFKHIGLDIEWKNCNTKEEHAVDQNGVIRVKIDPNLFREKEVHHSKGDSTKAKNILGWSPTTSFQVLVQEMLDSDIAQLVASSSKN